MVALIARNILFHSIDVIIFAIAVLYLLLCPFTKVEESFNTQATHDLLFFEHQTALKTSKYFDHFEFPGVVPRTFLGPIVLANIVKPLLHFFPHWDQNLSKSEVIYTAEFSQFLARLVLGFLCVFCNAIFRRAIAEKLGTTIATLYGLVFASQFHLLFYMTRPLPNTFALALVFLAFAYWLRGNFAHMFAILGVATTFFRGELLALIGPIALLECIIAPRYNFFKGLLVGIASVAVAIVASVNIDSYFWQRFLWPEGEVLLFNTVMNKSSEWGTHPFHWYFSSAIPRALLVTIVFIPLSLLFKAEALLKTWRQLLVAILFVLLYSLLPHKELRFIFYAIPLFNLVIAASIASIMNWLVKPSAQQAPAATSTTAKSVWKNIKINMFVFAMFLFTFAISLLFAIISSHNYFGGNALLRLHKYIAANETSSEVKVHLDVLTAMNGVTRFLQQHEKPSTTKFSATAATATAAKNGSTRIIYSKEERVETAKFDDFDYLITSISPSAPNIQPYFSMITQVYGLDKFNWRTRRIETSPKLYILKRKPLTPTLDSPELDLNSLRPNIKWTQRPEKIILTVEAYNVKPEDFKIEVAQGGFVFHAISQQQNKEKVNYHVKMYTFKELDTLKQPLIDMGSRWIKITLFKKQTSAAFWPRLQQEAENPKFLKVDWDNWVDDPNADEEEQQQGELESIKKSQYSNGHGATSTFIGKTFFNMPSVEEQKDMFEQLARSIPPHKFSLCVSIVVLVAFVIFHATSWIGGDNASGDASAAEGIEQQKKEKKE